MPSSLRVFILFILSCLADNSAGGLLSNPVTIYDQPDSASNLPLGTMKDPTDSPTVHDLVVNTEGPTALTGSTTSLEPLINTNDPAGLLDPFNVALAPTVPLGSVKIGDPTLDNTKSADDHSSNPAALSNPIPPKNFAFDWRNPGELISPIDCNPPRKIACCMWEGIMRFCEELVHRTSQGCKKATLTCCDEIDEEHQCLRETPTTQDEDVDSVERVGQDVRGGPTDTDGDRYVRDKQTAERNAREAERNAREAAQRKAQEDELKSQQELYQQEGDRIRSDAQKGSNWDIQWPNIVPWFAKDWIQDLSH